MRCRDLAQQVILVPEEADTDKLLEKTYKLFESVMSSLLTQLQEKKEDQTKQTFVLLRNEYKMFSKAHEVLKGHFEESIVIEEVLRSWVTYYGQVF